MGKAHSTLFPHKEYDIFVEVLKSGSRSHQMDETSLNRYSREPLVLYLTQIFSPCIHLINSQSVSMVPEQFYLIFMLHVICNL